MADGKKDGGRSEGSCSTSARDEVQLESSPDGLVHPILERAAKTKQVMMAEVSISADVIGVRESRRVEDCIFRGGVQ